jgi:hypothetical protein
MSVDFIPAAHVRALTRYVEEARQRALDRCGVSPHSSDARAWERLFEANAAEVLAALPAVSLPAGYVVRYRYFGQRGRDVLVRPFVARSSTDVDPVRHLLDWHAPPDSVAASLRSVPTQDVDLLYRHFSYPATAGGVFEYWLAMQEIWASGRWVHSHVITSAAEFSQVTAGGEWEVIHPVEAYEPAVVRAGTNTRLAVLIQSVLHRFLITLQQIDIDADQSLRYADPILVASGPQGYVA